MQDPYERADITSNTFWDWQINHVGSAYGMMDQVFQFAATFDEFPPRSFPPGVQPADFVLEGNRSAGDPRRAGAAQAITMLREQPGARLVTATAADAPARRGGVGLRAGARACAAPGRSL